MILNFFSSKSEHPLADAKELKRVLAELPRDNVFKALDEIHGWLESLSDASDLKNTQLFDIVRQLDEAAQVHVRRLSKDYLSTVKQSKNEERQRWRMLYHFWGAVSALYAKCLDVSLSSKKSHDQLKAEAPLAAARLMAARVSQLKWVAFRYGRIGEDLWQSIGQPLLKAEAAGFSAKSMSLYAGMTTPTSVAQLYLQAVALHASSPDCLRPVEIELVDRFVVHFLSSFQMASVCAHDSIHWIDASSGEGPVRLARLPAEVASTMRFLSFAGEGAINSLINEIERGYIPPTLNLGGEYPTRTVLFVLRHLLSHWSKEQPVRTHARHLVKSRMAVLSGFDDSFTVFAGALARLGKERTAESWVVENVSLGGFGAFAHEIGDWLGIGALLCLQPEGGDNWVLGCVKRLRAIGKDRVSVGIQTLSHQPRSVELRSKVAGLAMANAVPAILLHPGEVGSELSMVLPAGGFDVRESQELMLDGVRMSLAPLSLEFSGADFVLAKYRIDALL